MTQAQDLQLDLADPASIEKQLPPIEEIVATKRRVAAEAQQDFDTWEALLAKLRSIAGLVIRLEQPSGPNPPVPSTAALDAVVDVVEQSGGQTIPVQVGEALIAKGHEVQNPQAVFVVLKAAAEAGRLQQVAPRRFAPLSADDERPQLTRTMESAPEAHLGLDGPPPQSKAEAVIRVIASAPERQWATSDVSRVMVDRDWMTSSTKDLASLGSTLSRLYSEGKIFRPQRGRYQFAPPSEDGRDDET